jgi:glutamate formiminotransferase/formiminotetrahydrofolate cyclodeaminase
MAPLIECVPNFSEGRRAEVIREIVAALTVPGVQVLDVHSDAGHNRAVVTLVGPPEAVLEAAFAGVAAAARLINMDEHAGEHPRIGAMDVVPFVPLRGATMDECVELARRLGQRLGDELGIPVYLYEAAATRPDRVSLADVRRGEYEGLKREVEMNPDRAPDFGPARLGTAGATAVGARPLLIAFNVYLNTGDVEIAKRIARAVRGSSGGLPHVKALGLLVGAQAQVSMNLTDFARTPIHQALEMVRREAARYGVAVARSELVGLSPQQALLDAAAWYLQLDLDPQQVLENRLSGVILSEAKNLALQEKNETPSLCSGQALRSAQGDKPSHAEFLDALASEGPAPGGGSAAALAGALAAALAAKVARLTLGRAKFAAAHGEMETALAEAERLRGVLTARVDDDADAYTQVVAAYRLPRSTDDEQDARQAAIQAALVYAAEVPLATARDAVAALELAPTAARLGNPSAASDAGCAAHLARAAFEGAALNVRANAARVADREQVAGWLAELERLRVRCEAAFEKTVRTLQDRMGPSRR